MTKTEEKYKRKQYISFTTSSAQTSCLIVDTRLNYSMLHAELHSTLKIVGDCSWLSSAQVVYCRAFCVCYCPQSTVCLIYVFCLVYLIQ
jgi:hypothetical protein